MPGKATYRVRMVYPAIEVGDAATWGGTLIGVLMAGSALWQNHRQSKIQAAQNLVQREAAEQAHRQTEAAERRALAVEQMLAQLMSPSPQSEAEASTASDLPEIRWTVERRGKHVYVLRNVGNGTATAVRVDPANLPPVARNVPEDAVVRQNESVEFLMAATLGGPLPNEIWLTWQGQDQAVAVPLPLY